MRLICIIFILIFTIQETIACSCGSQFDPAPNTFCKTILGSNWEAPPNEIVKAIKLQDVSYGMTVKVLTSYLGFNTLDTIMIWGDEGLSCLTYTDQFAISDTFIFSIIGGFNNPYEYYLSACGVFHLNIRNDIVLGDISRDTSSMEIAVFDQYMFDKGYETSCNSLLINSSINSNSNTNVSIYPNPSSRDFKIVNKVDLIESVRIHNISGQNVGEYGSIYEYSYKVLTNNLEKGIYFFHIRCSSSTLVRRVIVE